MSLAFTTNDTLNCPAFEYFIDKVTDGNDANKSLNATDYLKVVTIDQFTGEISVIDTTNAVKWHIFLSASGQDGVKSGTATVQNVYLHLYDPPPAEVFPAEFKFVNDVPVTNSEN